MRGLLRPVGAPHVDRPIIALTGDLYAPGVATHFAVLDETTRHVGFDVDLAVLAAIRAGHQELIEAHTAIMLLRRIPIRGF